jgi:hypothetical protein
LFTPNLLPLDRSVTATNNGPASSQFSNITKDQINLLQEVFTARANSIRDRLLRPGRSATISQNIIGR